MDSGPSAGELTGNAKDDNGNRFKIDSVADRVAALARVLAFESGPVHEQIYWVEGPSKPACLTNRDLYQRVVNEGEFPPLSWSF